MVIDRARSIGIGTPICHQSVTPTEVAALIAWMATAPPELVLNEAIISPLEEEVWP